MAEASVAVLEKVRAAMGALEELMLSDAWDAVPMGRQRVVANALEAMRLDAERLETITVAWLSEMGKTNHVPHLDDGK